jgi:hypothetical protein
MKIPVIKSVFVMVIASYSLNVYAQKTRTKMITVEPYLVFQNYEHFKRLTLSSSDSNAEYIDDFTFEWGYLYKLKVIETEFEEWLSDGTRFHYRLDTIVSKTKMQDDCTFNLFIDPEKYYTSAESDDSLINNTIKKVNDSTFLYFDNVEIEIPEKLKSKFYELVAAKKTAIGQFTYIDENRIKLIAL